MKKTLLSLLFVTFLFSSCSDEANILVPVNIPGENFTGKWSGQGNTGTMQFKNLKFTKNPDSDNYKITGSVTLIFFRNSQISGGEFNPADNSLEIRSNQAGNYMTIKGKYTPEDEKLKGTWSSMGNTGTWSASKDKE